MAKLNFYPYYTEEEWNTLNEMVKKRFPNKRIKVGLSYMLREDIMKAFGEEECVPCEEKKERKIDRHFELDLPDRVIRVLNCKAKKLKIPVGALILRAITHPQLKPVVAEDSNSI